MSNKIESYAPGSFCWAELATSDVESAKKFYGEMFGWTAVELPMPGGVYVIFQSEGNDAAAARPASPGMSPHWGVYFSTASADESAGRVAPLGGKVVAGPFDVMEAGRMATVQDPAGVYFSLWQPGCTHRGHPWGPSQPGLLGRVDHPRSSRRRRLLHQLVRMEDQAGKPASTPLSTSSGSITEGPSAESCPCAGICGKASRRTGWFMSAWPIATSAPPAPSSLAPPFACRPPTFPTSAASR